MSEESARREVAIALIRVSSPYAARWADDRTSLGDFEGRDYAIDFFDVPVDEHQELRRQLRQPRRLAEQLFGRPIVLIFHTPEATARYYGELVASLSRIENAVLTQPLIFRVRGNLSRSFVATVEPSLKMPLTRAA